jgi:hypothetical protein
MKIASGTLSFGGLLPLQQTEAVFFDQTFLCDMHAQFSSLPAIFLCAFLDGMSSMSSSFH